MAGGRLGRDEDVTDLRARSIDVIAAGQAPSGAYSAAPTFGPYRDYCWLRDGSFTADAMSRVGETSSAESFFDWGAEIVRAKPAGPWDARYRLDGSHDDTSWWPHDQLDGLGLWAWATRNHVARHGVGLTLGRCSRARDGLPRLALARSVRRLVGGAGRRACRDGRLDLGGHRR